MAEPTRRNATALTVKAAERHDRICDRYEASWGAGAPMPLEDLLGEVPDEERSALLRDLIRLEREFRGPDAVKDEYLARFPLFLSAVESAFHNPAAETPMDAEYPAEWDEDAQPPPDLPGYEVFERIGTGGMGVVFRGRHLAFDMPVAIKMVKAGWHRPEDLGRFAREVKAVAKLNHPNIVRVFDTGEHNKLPFFSMELVDGGPLSKWLGGKPTDPTRVREANSTETPSASHRDHR